jgi:hypothetical protein
MAAASSALLEGDLPLATSYAASSRTSLDSLARDVDGARALLTHVEAELVRQNQLRAEREGASS